MHATFKSKLQVHLYHPDLPQFSEIHGCNTECAEQAFRWLNKFKLQCVVRADTSLTYSYTLWLNAITIVAMVSLKVQLRKLTTTIFMVNLNSWPRSGRTGYFAGNSPPRLQPQARAHATAELCACAALTLAGLPRLTTVNLVNLHSVVRHQPLTIHMCTCIYMIVYIYLLLFACLSHMAVVCTAPGVVLVPSATLPSTAGTRFPQSLTPTPQWGLVTSGWAQGAAAPRGLGTLFLPRASGERYLFTHLLPG